MPRRRSARCRSTCRNSASTPLPSPATRSTVPRASACSTSSGARRSRRICAAAARSSRSAAARRTSPVRSASPRRLRIMLEEYPTEVPRLAALRDRIIDGVTSTLENTEATAKGDPRLPNIAHLLIKGVEGEAMLLQLDAKGIAVSTGSACSSRVARTEPRPALDRLPRRARARVAAGVCRAIHDRRGHRVLPRGLPAHRRAAPVDVARLPEDVRQRREVAPACAGRCASPAHAR